MSLRAGNEYGVFIGHGIYVQTSTMWISSHNASPAQSPPLPVGWPLALTRGLYVWCTTPSDSDGCDSSTRSTNATTGTTALTAVTTPAPVSDNAGTGGPEMIEGPTPLTGRAPSTRARPNSHQANQLGSHSSGRRKRALRRGGSPAGAGEPFHHIRQGQQGRRIQGGPV